MAIAEHKMPILDDHLLVESSETEIDCSDIDYEYDSDDSESDPTYDLLEETHGTFSDLSISKKQRRPRVAQHQVCSNGGTEAEKTEVFDENDEKSYEMVKRLIRDGQLAKLKVDQCKVYLRKNGLRRTGNKDTLIQRIKGHCELINDGGEKKYPAHKFVLNCKGDACKGDVVLFEQTVYEKFNIASRSASGPPLGKRTVAGRIVHESYGAAKQQHTFTIEVLWSKGERPLPPLHPLLIKGRNLYRLKTLRQRWEDEGERLKILKEKHSRGSHARSDRESRMQKREKRKILKAERRSTSQPGLSYNTVTSARPTHQFAKSVHSQKTMMGPQQITHSHTLEQESCLRYKPYAVTDSKTTPTESDHNHNPVDHWHGGSDSSYQISRNNFCHINQQGATDVHPCFRRQNLRAERTNYIPLTRVNHPASLIPRRDDWHRGSDSSYKSSRGDLCWNYQQGATDVHPCFRRQNLPAERTNYIQPLTRVNYPASLIPRRDDCMQNQLCIYFSQGRCYYGENCRYSHDLR